MYFQVIVYVRGHAQTLDGYLLFHLRVYRKGLHKPSEHMFLDFGFCEVWDLVPIYIEVADFLVDKMPTIALNVLVTCFIELSSIRHSTMDSFSALITRTMCMCPHGLLHYS